MIHHLKGVLTDLSPTYAVLECHGVGYGVHITLPTFTYLNGKKEALLYIHPIYKEDSQTLYGFGSPMERSSFELLISVSGVGGNTARVILSSLSVSELHQTIASGDVSALQTIKGIGVKTAQRILVDLKDKSAKLAVVDSTMAPASGTLVKEAMAALEVLGYTPRQTESLLRKLAQAEEHTLEQLIKEALKKL